ncbi:MAG: dephospho-CoA kinase [Verrucomicrobia bacterium]|nr:dephospho-CoA kinase [Verrucomicrobiota bacterium]
MITLVVTGGIATGKSAFCRALLRISAGSSRLFDCDQCVHGLLTTEPIIARLTEVFGENVLDQRGQIDRVKLRDIVFSDASLKSLLEGIIHPEVRRFCRSARNEALASSDVSLFVADVPLFYENGFPIENDMTVVVATTRTTQLKRLLNRSPLDSKTAEHIIDAQLPISRKVELADIVMWNGGELSSMDRQIEYFLKWMELPSN